MVDGFSAEKIVHHDELPRPDRTMIIAGLRAPRRMGRPAEGREVGGRGMVSAPARLRHGPARTHRTSS
jgi:hypothetical protein